ncbi:helix-hairpin-helix domain-containing protein [Clostridium beijerinckii]|uniref:Competence protein ComEA n=1 Tax=Clostridium beijerinckii TaxID=1520 RepID=A0AAE5H9Z5_CLOBE|nr:helix-hairpin-helix domain-containing protein [Clostridium beijerinckii]NSB17219.1 competence protein ComEA [Clostridium beijerinckii]OOM24786.1 ComE operon protein 1 [Clostridium beijerinckii]
MVQEFLKDKKKIGILSMLFIVVIVLIGLYVKSGFKELKKNDTESIFVDDSIEADTSNDESVNVKNNNKSNNKDSKKQIVVAKNKNIVVAKNKNIVVEIKGEVKKPDVYTMSEDSIVKDLIDISGGLTENADLSNINRAKKLQDHELIYISNKNDENKEIQTVNSNSSNKDISNKKINLNSATLDQLKTLNGIGDSKAKGIIEYREKSGGFKSIEEIKNVSGIGDNMFERIKEQIEI